MQVFRRISVEQDLFKWCDAVGEQRIIYHHEAASMLLLVLSDEFLTLITRRVVRLEERASSSHPGGRVCVSERGAENHLKA